MGMTPICPRCGSVKVKTEGARRVCREPDCGHSGPRNNFKPNIQHPEHIQPTQAKWRDPVAMSMDGYDE